MCIYGPKSLYAGTHFFPSPRTILHSHTFYVLVGIRMLDPSYELHINMSELWKSLSELEIHVEQHYSHYTGLSNQHRLRNHRHGFSLYIQGLVADSEVSTFAQILGELWNRIIPGTKRLISRQQNVKCYKPYEKESFRVRGRSI